jgi:hypothetical protein
LIPKDSSPDGNYFIAHLHGQWVIDRHHLWQVVTLTNL